MVEQRSAKKLTDTTAMQEAVADVRNLLRYASSLGIREISFGAAPIGTTARNAEGSQQPASLQAVRGANEPSSGSQQGNRAEQLAAVLAEIGDCTRCKLCKGRTKIVFGVGNPQARIMFIGEGPGRDEDLQGEPFVGAAGQLLTKIIEAMGMRREEAYIANVVKCLRYNAMVQLGNGTWERIGRLVRKRYTGTVRTIGSKGEIVKRRVIGWHETPLAKRSVFRLTYQSARQAGASKCAVHLTGDHPVLTKRGYIEASKLNKSESIATGQGFSPLVRSVIIGMLLGDGHLNARSAHLSFSHSAKQSAYARFKAVLLRKELSCTTVNRTVSAGKEIRYPIIQCRTKAHRGLCIMRRDFYQDRRKKVPDYLGKELHPITLAIWFMDDGYLRLRPPRKPSAEIATCSFSSSDLEILIKGISQLGIQAYTRRNRIFFDTRATRALSKVIAPYVPPSMRWKLHPEISKSVPYQQNLFKHAGPLEVLYDQVEITKVDFQGTDKTFYCIDVEETHNFVTSGGVVHNCRPPNNRNPEPDEVATCKPFLVRQVEIIKPQAIICLGSVAAQNLLDTAAPISRLRGKFTEWQGIPVMPTFHPAFLLRNANMKKPVWEDMQKVMKRLAEGGTGDRE